MSHGFEPFWHAESFRRFLDDGLPALLADRLPLAGYRVEPAGERAVRIIVSLTGGASAEYGPLPVPDEQGVFHVEGRELVVLPMATSEHLADAEIRCVGRRLLDRLAERLGEAPPELVWTDDVLRRFLPLDHWIAEFLDDAATSQVVDDQNPLARLEHLRRLFLARRETAFVPEQVGRVCPVQTPEGPNVGRFLHVARGAAIRDGRLVVEDEAREASLSVVASSIPFLLKNDPARALMGANMMRQWIPPETVEPATVRTGLEPDLPGFWCGRDLLTAFLSLGGDTFEDGIVVSESAAERMSGPERLEVGDKLSNRHGGKGVVARILPDEDMPKLADGTPVELAFDFLGCHARRNQGLLLEAFLSRIARAEGEPATAGPFDYPDSAALRERARACGLSETGMERLALDGETLPRPATVGWVYWGRVRYRATTWIRAGTRPGEKGNQRQGELEFAALREAGAVANLAETFNTRRADREDAATLADRAAAGAVEPAGAPTPSFDALARRLAAAGIAARLEGERVTFAFAPPPEPALDLAAPVPHPWRPETTIDRIGDPGPEVREANETLARMQADGAPGSLIAKARNSLAGLVESRLDALLPADAPEVDGRVLFSGRAVVAPGPEFAWDRVGLPDEMARKLFGEDPDAAMEDAWVLVNRNPSLSPFTILAFRPVRIPDRAVRLPLVACWPLNADFDGDQVAVFRPLTEEAQREAAERLSLAGHVARDPEIVTRLVAQDAVFGLALASRTPEGHAEVEALAGGPVGAPDGFVTRDTLAAALLDLLGREGPHAALDAVDGLVRRGLLAARRSGASISPFADEWLAGVPDRRRERLVERIESCRDFDDPELGPQLLAVMSGARANVEWLLGFLDPPEDWVAAAGQSRLRLAEVARQFAEGAWEAAAAARSRGFNVLARAARSERPGIVFAQAAATGESDPLVDPWSRLFVGYSIESGRG